MTAQEPAQHVGAQPATFPSADEPGPAPGPADAPDRAEVPTEPEAPVPASAPASRRRGGLRRRPLRTALLGAAVLVVAGAAGFAATGGFGGAGGNGTASAAPSGPPGTVKVQRTTLTRTETVDGSLGYGTATAVQAPSEGPASAAKQPTGSATGNGTGTGAGAGGTDTDTGVLTWLPSEGDVIERGKPVYSIDAHKVPLLYGSTPLYRTLDVGVPDGADVEMLEKNLAALGYTGFTVDDTYTTGTAAAMRDWQDDLGRAETGTLAPGDAVVADGARRVADVKAALGGTPTGDVLEWTGTRRIVTVDLDVQDEDLVDDGTKATVTLPDGTEVQATVDDVGTAATAAPASGAGGGSGSGAADGQAPQATLPVRLSVADQHELGRYQAAPVDVTFAAQTRKNVLAVPINALVALREGGYALETVGSKGLVYVPVKLGMFADGMVEVSGADVTAGMVVGVPK